MAKWLRVASLAVLGLAAGVQGAGGSPATRPSAAASNGTASNGAMSASAVIPAAISSAAGMPVGPAAVTAALPFEKEVLGLEAAFRKSQPQTGGVLFYGSSSMRLWKNLKEDFAGLNVLNHGFGGSTCPDALRYFDRLVLPTKPSTIVFYEGDNDLGKGRTPEQLMADYQSFEKLVHAKLPSTRIIYLSVKPSPKRIDLINTQRKVNTLLEGWIKQSNDPRLSFVNTFAAMVDAKGLPRTDLFGPDKLHMNRDGYKIWTKLIGLKSSIEEKASTLVQQTK